MKRIVLVCSLLLAVMTLSSQQPKEVYITLDVSGSMTGDKYVLANYTTQMITTLCDDNDQVHMIVYGQEKNLSKEKDGLKAIQKPMEYLSFGASTSRMSQFDDIIGFNNIYCPSKKGEDWLFIIGDGYWGTDSQHFAADRQKFENLVKGGTLNVCYLQTCEQLTELTDFTQFAQGLGVIDIGKSSTDPKTIREGCDHFAKKILGFSEVSLNIDKQGSNAIKVVAELPVTEFIVVYQDEVAPERLPSITSAEADGKELKVKHKGTPTTLPVKPKFGGKTLSGHVWHLKADKAIGAKKAIVVNFDKEVSTKKVNVYPVVRNIGISTIGLTRVGGNLRQLDSKTFSICKDENKAQVRVELSETSKENLPEGLLKKTRVVVKANNQNYEAKWKDGAYECEIDLKEDETQYYAECDCPGYFKRVTPIMTIVKGEDCEEPDPGFHDVLRETADFGTMTFKRLKKDQIEGEIRDSETMETLDPNKFDLTVEVEDDFLYDEPKLSIDGNTLKIDVHPKGDWCECLFPTDLNIRVISTPKPGAFDDSGRNYIRTIHPIHLTIEKDRPWLSRCLWVIVTLAALLLFVVYLRMLMKKKRFKKNAMVTPKYYSYYGDLIEDQGGTKLRKEGFGAWFSRWLLPVDERTTLFFDKPAVSGLTVIASESKDVVNLLKTTCDFNTMDIGGYDPETDTGKSKTIKWGDMGVIDMSAPNGSKDGELIFSSGSENDGAGYRLLLGLLMAASLIAIIVLLFLTVRSLF